MNLRTALFTMLAATLLGGTARAQTVDVARFLKERGATQAHVKIAARSPDPAVVPVMFFDRDGNAPACGLLIAAPRAARPRSIELTGPDAGEGFPACVAIPSITPFRLQGRRYLMVEYHHRETREDTYASVRYLYDAPGQGYLSDAALDGAGPAEAPAVSDPSPSAARTLAGIKQARAAVMKSTFPQWRFQERDFIADNGSSFAAFVDDKTHDCHVVAEAGAAPVAARAADFVPGQHCAGLLATTRLAVPAATYYLAMFKSDGGEQLVGIMSVAANGRIEIARALAAAVNRAHATATINAAKTALSEQLRRTHGAAP